MNRSTRLPLMLLMLLVSAALLAAGCGEDGDGGGEGGGEELSKEEFVAQADEICAEGDAKIDEGGKAFAGTTGGKVEELVGTVVAPGYRDQIAQLRELEPPADEADEVEEWLDTFEQGVDELADSPKELAGGAALDTIVESRGMASELGLGACARGF
ncbi:MAG: hypothetical protein FJW90_07445 [Actinobacteria bacterium]|nr:hypothetical protein [Actinomycetota bacterium]